MADNRPGRPEDAGDRNRDSRLRARFQRERDGRWDIPEDGRRAHRRSRGTRGRRSR